MRYLGKFQKDKIMNRVLWLQGIKYLSMIVTHDNGDRDNKLNKARGK